MSTVFPTSPSNGDTYIPPQVQKLLASDRETSDSFGESVFLSADGFTLIVGARAESTSPNTLNGAAYVFTRSGSTWTEQTKLLASDVLSDTASNARFGWSVALSSDGNTALIGAWGEATSPTTFNGAAYVFTRTAGVWTEQQKILASDRAAGDNLGYSVALSSDGNIAFIGARAESTSPNTNQGAAYVFTRTAGIWTEQQKLTASDRASTDYFGASMAISSDGNTALIGAYLEDTSPNTDNGAAYVFTRSAGVWTQQQKLLASDLATGDEFGASVALSSDGNTAIVGARYENTSPNVDNGAAYVFTRSGSTWTQQQKLLASDRAGSDRFGWSVSLSANGNIALIGAYLESASPITNNGAAYVFTRSGVTWTQKQKLVASDRASGDEFGWSVALSSDGNIALIGASGEDTSPTGGQGAAYVYNFNNTGTRYTYNATDNRWEIDTSIPKKAPTTHLFTSSVSSWTIPTSARAIHAVVIGGGGAGGMGGSGTSVAGGGGGGGGGMSIHTYNLISGYQTTAVITVGAGGSGSGSGGGTSSFKIADSGSLGTLIAAGGSAGFTGGTTLGQEGSGGIGMFTGGAGGAGLDTGSNDSPAISTGARGGGSGGGNHTSSIGGNGNVAPLLWTTSTINPGAGGGGGLGSSTNFGTIGSPGNLYGGGGGGGGAGASGFGGAIGRAGAQGCVFLTIWYE
jgi:hypothetical protein